MSQVSDSQVSGLPPAGARRVPAEALERFMARLFESFGVSGEHAAIAAEVLVVADLHGIDSHGSARLGFYAHKLEKGLMNPVPRIRIVAESPAGCVIDGDNGLGHAVGRFAMDECIRRARPGGVAGVSVTHSNHYGIAGYYALRAVPHDMIGVSMTNGTPLVAPTFGREKMLGANPIAVAVPTGRGWPFLLDMSTCTVAAGKLQLALQDGKPIPEGWAIDEAGRPTTDPAAGFKGALLPLGGTRELGSHKGYGLAVVVDILCALLSGAAWGPHCGGLIRDFHEVSNIGHFFAALRVDAFRPLAAFQGDLDAMLNGLRSSALAAGEPRIYVHGEPEFEEAERRRRDGIPLHPSVDQTLRRLAASRGLESELP